MCNSTFKTSYLNKLKLNCNTVVENNRKILVSSIACCDEKLQQYRKRTVEILSIGLYQACPWELDSYGIPMGNVPWDGTGINCYGMGQINMSHGQP